MTSAINPAYPVEGTPTTESVRGNFEAAKTEIEALQTGKQDTLISGSTIKTVAGKSVVGAGNVAITKEDVGLPNVDNTSDMSKPVSTAQQAAIAAAVADRPVTATVETIAAMNASEAVQDHVSELNPHIQYLLTSEATELIQDTVGSSVKAGSGVAVSYNDASGQTEISVPPPAFPAFSFTLLNFQFSDAATGWSTSGNQTITYDSANKGLRIKGNGVSGTNILTTKNLPNPIQSSAIQRIAVRFKSNTPGLQAGLYIQLGNAGNTFSALNAAYSLLQIGSSDDPSWHWAIFQTAEDATFAGLGTLTQIRFRTNTQSAPYLNDVTISEVVINPATVSPVVFTFDDGWDTTYTKAFPKLESVGFKGTVFWPSSGAPGVGSDRRIDIAELTALRAAGWDIALDGTDDDSVLTAQASVGAAVQKFLKGQQVALTLGFSDPAFDYLCYPNGSAWIAGSPVQISAATSNGTTTVTLGAAATIVNGSAYYAANAPDGTTVVVGGVGVTSITVSQNIPAGTLAAAAVDLSSVFTYSALTDQLSAVGVKGARLTSLGDNSVIDGLTNPLKIYAYGVTGKSLNTITAELTILKNRGVPIVTYFHEVVADVGGWNANTANPSINIYESCFNGMVDLVKSWVDAETAKNFIFSEYVNTYTG